MTQDIRITALDALRSIPPQNFKHGNDFGKPFSMNAKGQTLTVASPAGWLAQHPALKAAGVQFIETEFAGGIKRFVPTLAHNGLTVRNYAALAMAMGMDPTDVQWALSPSAYPNPDTVTPEDVADRFATAIKRSGGGDILSEHDGAIKAHARAAEKAEKDAVKAEERAKAKALKEAEKAKEREVKEKEKAEAKAKKDAEKLAKKEAKAKAKDEKLAKKAAAKPKAKAAAKKPAKKPAAKKNPAKKK